MQRAQKLEKQGIMCLHSVTMKLCSWKGWSG